MPSLLLLIFEVKIQIQLLSVSGKNTNEFHEIKFKLCNQYSVSNNNS